MRLAAITTLLVFALAGLASAHPGHSNTALSIVVRDGADGVKRAKLYCLQEGERARGFLRSSRRRVRRLCERAYELDAFLRTPPDPDRMCTQVYGSPHTARIRGYIDARPVDRRLHRRDGCGIADWHRARMLLGGEPASGTGESGGGSTDPRDHRCRGWCHPEPLSRDLARASASARLGPL